MQPSDEEKLNDILGNISEFFHEIDTRHEDNEPELKHGRTEFDSEEDHVSLRAEWTAITERLKHKKTTKPKKQTPRVLTTPRALMKRFWSRYGLTDDEIGRRYEMYIGWHYETLGWKVKYNGVIMGLEDAGIDLICTKGKKILLVQCKNWNRNSFIHVKYIHQLFGSATDYKMNVSGDFRIGAAFYTSALFSDDARDAAEKFHIMLHEQYYLKRFPCIKCKSENKTYYIPHDPGYFTLSMDTKNGDMLCNSIDEAESFGFRHS